MITNRMFYGSLALVVMVALAMVFYIYSRSRLCDWCKRPYAFWNRAGGKVCRRCKNDIKGHVHRQLYQPPTYAGRRLRPFARG